MTSSGLKKIDTCKNCAYIELYLREKCNILVQNIYQRCELDNGVNNSNLAATQKLLISLR
jgi:hypothetical protein